MSCLMRSALRKVADASARVVEKWKGVTVYVHRTRIALKKRLPTRFPKNTRGVGNE